MAQAGAKKRINGKQAPRNTKYVTAGKIDDTLVRPGEGLSFPAVVNSTRGSCEDEAG